ncbi:TPA: hydroxymethylglutaryl-CoA reductase, degradative [Candidatus Geothermarchaeota archaeon]|nr:hydroxymethylglutaryl-CoA reductase, degradative [Candidatus Geothermarchaeota archaeon]
MNSRIPGFYKLSLDERLRKIAELVDLTSDDIKILKSFGEINPQVLDAMIENVIGVYPLPYGVAVNFRINGRDYIVPMVVEESSVVAAASNAARLLRDGDGIESISTDQIMIGQIQLIKIDDLDGSAKTILDNKERLLEVANMQSKTLRRLGGGAKDIIVRRLETRMGDMLIVHIYVDVKDAMGANIVNTMCEALGPVLEELTGGKALLKILSNYTDRRIVKVKARVSRDVIGDDVIENIEYASAFAESDPYRAVTHNKGIMNGVIAVALATGQDTRAIGS